MTNKPPALDEHTIQVACKKCFFSGVCLPVGLTQEEVEKLDEIIERQMIVHKGDVIFEQSKPFTALCALRVGALKSVRVGQYGQAHITAFHFPGDLVGLEAIHDETYKTSCIALDTSSVCMIPYDKLLHLSSHLPSLNQHIMQILSENLSSAGHYSINDGADERVAKFILNVSTRFKRSGNSPSHFTLPMARLDIADYLGLANETLSRSIKRIHDEGIIRIQRRDLEILDIRRLQILSCGV